MEESIYNLIPQPVPEASKPLRYQSKFNPETKPTYSTFGITGTSKPGYDNVGGDHAHQGPMGVSSHAYKKSHATFGTMNNSKKPNEILAKGTGKGGGAVPLSSEVGSFTYTDKRKPAVPPKKECAEGYKAMHPPQEDRDFVTKNAVENMTSKPKKPQEPTDWTKKPHFGEVPPYLRKIKNEIADEYEYIRTMQETQETQNNGMRQLDEGERLELIDQLKAKWDEVNAAYQKSSVLSLASLDTIGKVKRKEMYESQLAQIERDIDKLSKKVVYVAIDS